MTRYTLHVPEALNDGTPLTPQQTADIEEWLLAVFGGFTQTVARGAWRSDTQSYIEPMRLYLIDSDDSPQTAQTLQRLAGDIARELQQEAVYLTRQDIETFLVTPAREKEQAWKAH